MKRRFSVPLLAAAAALGIAMGAPANLLAWGRPSAGEAPALRQRIISSRQVPDEPYRLQQGDELDISVWDHPELTRKVLIRDDGLLPFPPLEPIQAEGLSVNEFEQNLLALLRAHMAAPPGLKGASPDSGGPASTVISPRQVPQEIYRLQPGDQLEISVWGQTDLDRTVAIGEDGAFSFPLIGSVQAVRRTLREVEQEIQERLDRDYVINPQVTVRLFEARYSVVGDVKNPGPYALQGQTDLLTAIGQAGGYSEQGPSRIDVIRRRGEETLTIRAFPQRILSGDDPNVALTPHDTVVVKVFPVDDEVLLSVRLHAAKFSVFGDVERPGSYLVEGSMDLLTAISQAGGITKFGSNRVDVVRIRGNEKLTIRANIARTLDGKDPNIAIHPRDSIYVRRRLL